MRKVWIYPRTDRNSFEVQWMEHGNRQKKAFPNRKLAEHYQKIKYGQLNSDVFLSARNHPWDDARKQFLELYDSQAKETKKIMERFLDRLEEFCAIGSTRDFDQHTVNLYFKERKLGLSNWTLKKDAERFGTLLNWLVKSKYLPEAPELPTYKTVKPNNKSLSDDEIKAILQACPSQEWRLRILMGLCTGLRKEDFYRLPRTAVDFAGAWVDTNETKTGKAYSNPLPDALMPLLVEYDKTLPPDRKYFFKVHSVQWLDRQWRGYKSRYDKQVKGFRPFEVTIQDLRRTYSTRVETTGISTAMLNHANKGTTRVFYNDMDYIRWIRVNQLPVDLWLAELVRIP